MGFSRARSSGAKRGTLLIVVEYLTAKSGCQFNILHGGNSLTKHQSGLRFRRKQAGMRSAC